MRLPWKRQKQWQERLGRSKTILWEKLREALASVVPITVIVLILSFTVAPIPPETLLAFLIGAVMVILGIGLFSLGADTAMTPIGERVPQALDRGRRGLSDGCHRHRVGAGSAGAGPAGAGCAQCHPGGRRGCGCGHLSGDRHAAHSVLHPAEPDAGVFLHHRVCRGLLCAGGFPGHRL